MGYYEKRGNNSWRIRTKTSTPTGTEVRSKTIRFPAEMEADVQLLHVKKELANMEANMAAQVVRDYTLRTWTEEWLDRHLALDCSPVTIANYRYLLNSRILPQLGDMPLADLTPAVLTDWLIGIRTSPKRSTVKRDEDLKHPRKGARKQLKSRPDTYLSNKTITNYYGCMYSALEAAVRCGLIPSNPMNLVKRPKKHKAQLTVLSEEGAIRLLEDLKEEPAELQIAVALALCCSLRLGEVVALRYKDIDPGQMIIHVRHAVKYTTETGQIMGPPKTEDGVRDIALPEGVFNLILDHALAEQLELQEEAERNGTDHFEESEWIIHGRDGRQLNKDTPSRWFRRFADEHGYPGLRFHDLRHAHASILVANNVDVAAIAHRMGHSDATTTLRNYTHAFRQRDELAAKTMDSLLAVARPELVPAPEDDGEGEE